MFPILHKGRRLRIVMAVPSLAVGGMEQVVKTLTLNLDPTKFDVSVVCLCSLGSFSQELTSKGIHVQYVKPGQKFISPFLPHRLISYFRDLNPDIVHSHSGCWLTAALASRLAGVPLLIHTEHGRFFPEKAIAILMDRLATKLTHYLVCVSDDLCLYMSKVLKFNDHKIRVFPNGVPIDHFEHSASHTTQSTIRYSLGIRGDAVVIVAVGRLEPVKAHDLLIRAFQRLRSRISNIYLWILGNGSCRQKLECQIHQSSLTDSVFLMGEVSNVAAFLAEADIFVQPSLSEGTPMSVLEAMASRLPVIATHVGGLSKIVGENAGILIQPNEEDELYDALSRMIQDGELRQALAFSARQRVMRYYSCHAMTKCYEELYFRAVSCKGCP
ncbi:MAG: glycosyltransferase [Deltaproteobacteria bacterium]|nr:glycosyltransferase [Deltaproteobacteria bacterium]